MLLVASVLHVKKESRGYMAQLLFKLPAATKVMFLLVSVILLTGGSLPQCMLGRRHPPGRKHPLGRKHPPQDTVNERPVRILLECILVYRK